MHLLDQRLDFMKVNIGFVFERESQELSKGTHFASKLANFHFYHHDHIYDL
jgi:hypothetical protein